MVDKTYGSGLKKKAKSTARKIKAAGQAGGAAFNAGRLTGVAQGRVGEAIRGTKKNIKRMRSGKGPC